jgi:acyl dehydratase
MDKLVEKMGVKPVQGRITDESIAEAKKMIGVKLRTEQYLRDASVDTITNFVNGIGDLNPLYRDQEYGRWTRFGSLVAHPMFPYAQNWPGRTRWGFSGVHGFYAGNDWEFFKAIKPGDRINCYERVAGVDERESKFSGRLAIQYVDTIYTNQHDDVVARVLGWCTRHERETSKEKGKYADVPKKHEYTNEELDHIEAMVLGEPKDITGKETKYWEDAQIGEELPPIARGPLSLMDTMGWLVGVGRGHTHGVLLQEAVRHPAHFFRNPEAGGGVEYTGIGHHRDSVAQEVGVPGTYDYGPQRTSWMASLVTNWMGDDAFLKRLRAEMRRFNVIGDTTLCKGKVKNKYIKDRYALVDIEIWAENQRGEITAPGIATVMLPSRSIETHMVVDGSRLNLDLPIPR